MKVRRYYSYGIDHAMALGRVLSAAECCEAYDRPWPLGLWATLSGRFRLEFQDGAARAVPIFQAREQTALTTRQRCVVTQAFRCGPITLEVYDGIECRGANITLSPLEALVLGHRLHEKAVPTIFDRRMGIWPHARAGQKL